MIRTTTITLAALLLTAAAESQVTPACEWGNLIDGKTSAGDQNISISLNTAGELYTLSAVGSTEQNPAIYYAGEKIFDGYPYNTGSSHNNNLLLLKTGQDGCRIWDIHSESGDISGSDGSVTTCSDGGCIVAVKLRHSDGATDSKPIIVDALGNRHELDWTCTRRYYRPLVMKVSLDGKIEWTCMPDVSTAPAPKATGNSADFTADAISIGKGAVDKNGCYYMPLNFRNPITFDNAGGSRTSFSPVNVKEWTGDAQTACGDFLTIKLDNNGKMSKAFLLEGEAVASYAQRVADTGDGIIIYGYVKGSGSQLKAGSFSLMPSEAISPVLVKADHNLNVAWAKCLKGATVNGKQGLQNVNISLADGNIWLCGQFNLKISDGDNELTSSQGNIREGFLLKLRLSDGQWLAARNSRQDEFSPSIAKTGLTGYMGVLANPSTPSKVWAYGYVMNGNVGVVLREYDSETLSANLDHAWSLVTKGGAPTATGVAYDALRGTCFITARGNSAFQPMEGSISAAPEKWGVYLAKFKLPGDMATSVELAGEDYGNLNVSAVQGGLWVNASASAFTVRVYDIAGRLAALRSVKETRELIPLCPGVYIVEGKKYMVR